MTLRPAPDDQEARRAYSRPSGPTYPQMSEYEPGRGSSWPISARPLAWAKAGPASRKARKTRGRRRGMAAREWGTRKERNDPPESKAWMGAGGDQARRIFSERSRARTECVSAPLEMKST